MNTSSIKYTKLDNTNLETLNLNLENTYNNWKFEITDNNLELEKLKIRLKFSTSLKSKQNLENDEYEFIKLLNKQMNLQCQADYFASVETHKYYIVNPEKYFNTYNLWLNWYDFLGLDTSMYCQTIDSWRAFCLNIGVSSLEDYNKKSKIYKELPANPCEFYPHFNDTLTELGIHILRR